MLRFLGFLFDCSLVSLAAELMKLGTTDLEAAQVISPEQSQTLVDDSVAKFGRELTHSFVVILSVLLDDGVFALLCKQVQHQKAEISDSQSITLKVRRKIGNFIFTI